MSYADMPAIPSLQRVRELNAAVMDADAAIVAAEQEVVAAEQRRLPLRERLAAVNSGSVGRSGWAGSLVDALVADPTSAPDVDAITAAVSENRKAEDVRNYQRSVIEQAIEKIGEEVAAATARVEDARKVRDTAWESFVAGAHLYLGAQLCIEVERLRLTILEPMLELQKLGSGWQEKTLVDHRAIRLDKDFSIKVRQYEEYEPIVPQIRNLPMPVGSSADKPVQRQAPAAEPRRVRFKDKALFPLSAHEAKQVTETAIERLRASLVAVE